MSLRLLCQTPTVKSRWLQNHLFSTFTCTPGQLYLASLPQSNINLCILQFIYFTPSFSLPSPPPSARGVETKRITWDSLASLSSSLRQLALLAQPFRTLSLCLLLYLVQLEALLHPDPIVL